MDVKIRRRENNLRTLGIGVLAFGLWTFVKYMLTFFLYGEDIDEALTDIELTLLNIIIWIVSSVSLLIKIYIGISARSESMGKRESAFYIILTGWMALFALLSIIGEIYLIITQTNHLINAAITLIIDVTSLTILVELMVNAIGLRSLRKKVAKA